MPSTPDQFPRIEQTVHMGVGELEQFFKGTPWAEDPRVKAFLESVDGVMDAFYEAAEAAGVKLP